MGSWIAFEPAISIEGLAFDVFGKSELLARQASSTLLAVFTFACALGVTIGGFIYDLAGWRGMSVFHVVCQSSMVFLFATQPSTLISFREFFHRSDPLVDDSDDSGLHTVVPATPANPATSAAGPAVRGTPPASHREDLVVEEVADSVPELPGTVDEASGVASGEVGEVGAVCSGMRQSAVSCVSQNSHRSTVERRSWRGPHLRHSVTSAASRLTKQTMKSHKSFHTVNTKGSKGTQGTFLSKVTGGDEAEDKKTKGIPKDLRIPALLIVMCCLNNNLSYVLEFSTFAIFFKEYHGWNSALWASLAQSAGDLTAAIMMKLLGAATDDDEEAGILRRLTKQPYSLSCLLFIWLLCNLGMTSPWLPLAVTAQVIMGTVYVYTSKLTTDLNLFYSLGDQSLFLHLQVWCKNLEALGGCAASFLGPFLFETVSPFFPFFVSATFSLVTFILFTSGFCQRLGFPPDVEAAEAQRSRRLGLRRVSHWSVNHPPDAMENLDIDGLDEFDDEDEELGWSLSYFVICILMPTFNGFMNGYSWSGYALHYTSMGWPLSRSGLSCFISFLIRPFFQQIQIRCGLWVIVPLSLCHLALAILGLIYTDKDWIAFEAAITIEGLAFDVFGKSELLARQASSTLLAVFTFACALGVTIGGIIYDFAGWQGMSVFHVVCQASMVFLFTTQPSTRESFREFFSPESPDDNDELFQTVVPAPAKPALVAASRSNDGDLVVEEFAADLPGIAEDAEDARPGSGHSARSAQDEGEEGDLEPREGDPGQRRPRKSLQSRKSRRSVRSSKNRDSWHSGRVRASVASEASRLTRRTLVTEKSFRTSNTKGSKVTQGTFLSRGIPKDLRIPAFLIVLCCFNNNFSYVFEFSTFAVYFKVYHGWNAAMWASFAQTAGDLTAAIMMKVLGAATDDDEEAGILRRLTKQPYSLSCLLFIWILCNLGMTSPWLPLAVTAQVIMGTVYVYTSKLTTDLNLFYSLGDQPLFLSLQVWCKNVEALGGCAASFLGPLLFEAVSPFFPFFVSVTFILFTSGFCQRLGFPPDVETAEAQRSRRLGLRRVSHWSVVSRKSHHNLEQVEARLEPLRRLQASSGIPSACMSACPDLNRIVVESLQILTEAIEMVASGQNTTAKEGEWDTWRICLQDCVLLLFPLGDAPSPGVGETDMCEHISWQTVRRWHLLNEAVLRLSRLPGQPIQGTDAVRLDR
eukprot:g3664.t1